MGQAGFLGFVRLPFLAAQDEPRQGVGIDIDGRAAGAFDDNTSPPPQNADL